MYRWASVVAVLVLLSLEGLLAQELSNDDYNRATEIFQNCKCVLYHQCDLNNVIITTGFNTLQGRLGISRTVNRIECRGGRFRNEIVCCKENGTNTESSTFSSATPSTTTVGTTERTLIPSTRGPFDEVPYEFRTTCGIQKPTFDARIHTGKEDLESVEGEFPWIATIFKRTPADKYKFICSGTLIHPNVVLTINHCVHKKIPGELKVVVNGEIKRSLTDASPEAKRDVSEIIKHPRYDNKLLYNDAALLIVERPFQVTTWGNINTLCLPPQDVYLGGKKCLVAGWGEDNEGQSVTRLRKTQVPFVNHTHCQDLLRKTQLGRFFNLHSSFMCAGGERGKDACMGDGGSPLMCQTHEGSNQYFQAGIVSWGIDCGREDVPGVYTNVAEITEWIRDVLSMKQLSI